MPSVQLVMPLLSKLCYANADLVTTHATLMQLCCALLHANLHSQDDADAMQVRVHGRYTKVFSTHTLQVTGCAEILLRSINTYGYNEGCAQWLLQAFYIPLALNEIVRIEFLNFGGLITFTRLLELHPSSRDVAAAMLKITDSLLDDPRLKVEIKKKVRSTCCSYHSS